MSDLISRQAVDDAIYDYSRACDVDYAQIMEYIDKLPTAQPEIIRCKDCKKREHCRTTNTWAVAPSDDWFCADAERRTDG